MACMRLACLSPVVALLQSYLAVSLSVPLNKTLDEARYNSNNTQHRNSLPIPDIPPYLAPDDLLYFFDGSCDPTTSPMSADIGQILLHGLLADLEKKPRSVRIAAGRSIHAYSADGREVMSLQVTVGSQSFTYGQCVDMLDWLVQHYPTESQYRHDTVIFILVDGQTRFVLRVSGVPPGEKISISMQDHIWLDGDFFANRQFTKGSIQNVLHSAKSFLLLPEHWSERVAPDFDFEARSGNARLEMGISDEGVTPDITYDELADLVDQLWLWLMHRGTYGALAAFWGRGSPLVPHDEQGIIAISEISLGDADGAASNLTETDLRNITFA